MLEKYTLTTGVHRFGVTRRIVSVIVICLFAIAITVLSGCSDTQKISSSDRQQVIMRTPSVTQCVEEESSSADGNYGPGTYIEIPDPCDGYPVMKGGTIELNYSSYSWPSSSNQKLVHDVWVKKGSKFEDHIATIDGMYVVAVRPKFGSVGQIIEAKFDDGSTIMCVIGDAKGEDAGSEWGHVTGGYMNILEYLHDGSAASNAGKSNPKLYHKPVGITVYQSSVLDSNPTPVATTSNGGTSDTGELVGEDTAEQIWNFLKAQGFTDECAAAVMGNMQQESGLSTTATNPSSGAYGICQWLGGRLTALEQRASENGVGKDDLLTQLEHLMSELPGEIETYSSANLGKKMTFEEFKSLTDIEEATKAFCLCFERPGSWEAAMDNRVNYANEFYARFKGTADTVDSETNDMCEEQTDGDASSGYTSFDNIHFTQTDYTDTPYWGGSIATHGCGICSRTVIVNGLLGKDYTPPELLEVMGDWRGMDAYLDDTTGSPDGKTHRQVWNDMGIECEQFGKGVDALKEQLAKGRVVLLLCGSSDDGQLRPRYHNKDRSSYRESNGHFTVIYAYRNGVFLMQDSSYSDGPIEYTEEELINDLFKDGACQTYHMTSYWRAN